MSEHLIPAASGVTLCAEAFGDPHDPAVLLIMGAMASMVWWPEPFCRALAARGRRVIRYDHRDTGRSTTFEPGTLTYTLDDLADDALAVLDGHGVARAHVVGMSLGGIVGQLLAMRDPGRVATLTAWSSTPYGPVEPPLPGMDAAWLDAMGQAAPPAPGDDQAAIAFHVDAWRRMAGPGQPFDEASAHTAAVQEVARAARPASAANHALLEAVPLPPREMGGIRAPTLVIHGTHDPVLPYPHGEAIAAMIPGARLLTLAGGGHELNRAEWPRVLDALAAHTA